MESSSNVNINYRYLSRPTFPSTCLAPDQPGYGQVVPTGQGRRRARRSTQTAIMQMPRAPAGWTVVTPNNGGPVAHGSMRESAPLYPSHSHAHQDYQMNSPYQSHAHPRDEGLSERHHYSPVESHIDARSPTLSHEAHRYGTSYSSHPPTSFRKPTAGPATKTGLSLDIHSLSMREGSSKPSPQEDIRLAPILGSNGSSSGDSPYSLPPISAMESLRDGGSSDSAAVLRRLRMDDNDYPKAATKSSDEQAWTRRHSLSTSCVFLHVFQTRQNYFINYSVYSRKPIDTSPRFQPYNSPRSHQEHSTYRPRSSSSASHGYHQPVPKADHAPLWSEASHEGDSTSNPSPTSPATPNSLSESEDRAQSHYSSNMARGKHFPGIAGRLGQQWALPHSHMDRDGRISETDSFSLRRNSYDHSDSDSTHPHRPW